MPGLVWRVGGLALALALATTLAVPAKAGSYIFTDIADISGTLDSLDTARLNDTGTVAFHTRQLIGGADVRTIYTGSGGAVTQIAQSSNAGGGLPVLVGFHAIANDGTVQYSTVDGFGGDRRLVHASGGTHTTIFSLNSEPALADAIPGNWISDNGQHVAFKAGLAAGGSGVFTGDGTPGGPFTQIATSAAFDGINNKVVVNNSGTAAFFLDGAIVKGDGSGPLTTIVDTGGLAPTGETFAAFGGEVMINNNGDVAFVGLFPGFADGGYYVGNGGALTEVLRFSDLPKTVFNVSNPDINDAGLAAFLMEFEDGTRGIYTGADLDGDKVIATGDSLFDSVVVDVGFFRGLNNDGSIAFGVGLADGSLHVVRADSAAVPAPATAFVFGAALFGLGAMRRRRHGIRA